MLVRWSWCILSRLGRLLLVREIGDKHFAAAGVEALAALYTTLFLFDGPGTSTGTSTGGVGGVGGAGVLWDA